MFLDTSNKKRTRAYRRHQRTRAIAHKLYIIKHIQFWDNDMLTKKHIGKLAKGKVHCSCNMCKFEKHYEIEHHKYKSYRKVAEEEIKDYV